MNNVQATVDKKTVEFLLDLPSEFELTDIKMENDSVILSISTELEVPSTATLQYQTDEYGNIALVGLDE